MGGWSRTQQPDYVALRVSEALKATAELEVIEAPGLTFSIPKVSSQRRNPLNEGTEGGFATCRAHRKRGAAAHAAPAATHCSCCAARPPKRQARRRGVYLLGLQDYQGLPRLVGRAVVQFEVQRRDGAPQAFVDSLRGGLSNTAKIQVGACGASPALFFPF